MNFEIMHWVRNREQAVNPIVILLCGTKCDANSPLAMLQGCENEVLRHIASYSVSPCSCCKHVSPVVYCCRRRIKVVHDRSKKPRDPALLAEGGEVPDELFLNEKVLLYTEGLCDPSGWGGSIVKTAESGGWATSGTCMVQGYSFLACTDKGLRGLALTRDHGKLLWNEQRNVLISANEPESTLSLTVVYRDPNPGSSVAGAVEKIDFSGEWIRTPKLDAFVKLICEMHHDALHSTEYRETIEAYGSTPEKYLPMSEK